MSGSTGAVVVSRITHRSKPDASPHLSNRAAMGTVSSESLCSAQYSSGVITVVADTDATHLPCQENQVGQLWHRRNNAFGQPSHVQKTMSVNARVASQEAVKGADIFPMLRIGEISQGNLPNKAVKAHLRLAATAHNRI